MKKRLVPNLVFTSFAFIAINVYFLLYFSGNKGVLFIDAYPELSVSMFLLVINTAMLVCSLAGSNFYYLQAKMEHNRTSVFIQAVALTLVSTLIYATANLAGFYLFFLIETSVSSPMNLAYQLMDEVVFGFSITFYAFISLLILITANLHERVGSMARLIYYMFGNRLSPRLTYRGFLFIDLNNSTQLAEQLGDEKYARLLHDCFRRLEILLQGSRFRIYQYIGDEAVISWGIQGASVSDEAICLFLDFKRELEEHSSYFQETYGIIPNFKCAIHSGEVVESEIGKAFQQLVYQGDVLNTTARILGQCHQFDADLLVSAHVMHTLPRRDQFIYDSLGSVPLKGKQERVYIYRIHSQLDKNQSIFFLNQKVTNSHFSLFKSIHHEN